jgi:hypothetical protein
MKIDFALVSNIVVVVVVAILFFCYFIILFLIVVVVIVCMKRSNCRLITTLEWMGFNPIIIE